jgi:hypothetical protein
MAAVPSDESNGIAPAAKAEAWAISFSSKPARRRVSAKEKAALTGGNRVDNATGELLPTVDVSELADESVAIPRNLTTTSEDMDRRLLVDLKRLQCVSRPQYRRTCGISSLTSVWNYLYSRLGAGTLPVVSQEEVMTILGFKPPFDNIRWGSFTGNATLLRWFHALNSHFGVTGKAYYAWKCHGRGKTFTPPEDAETLVKDGLRNAACAFIYHCHNHYMVPVGYHDQPRAQIHAYAAELRQGEYEPYLYIGEVSRGIHPAMHIVKFSDVALDLHCQSPSYFNIRHPELGVQQRKTKRTGGNLHCFLAFRSDLVEENLDQFQSESEEDDGDNSGNDTPVDGDTASAARATPAD